MKKFILFFLFTFMSAVHAAPCNCLGGIATPTCGPSVSIQHTVPSGNVGTIDVLASQAVAASTATVSLNAATASEIGVTLTANVTSWTITNCFPGKDLSIVWIQGAGAPWTLTGANAIITHYQNQPPILSPTLGAKTATLWHCVSATEIRQVALPGGRPPLSPGAISRATNVTVGTSPFRVAVGDLNRDGRQDVVAANNGSANISVLLGNGMGGFAAATNTTVGTSPNGVVLGDLNGDGVLDLVSANAGSANISVLLGNGSGGWTGAAANTTVGTNPLEPALADLNSDGVLDLAVSNFGTSNISVLIGNGSGGWTGAATNTAVGTNPVGLALGDLSGDGKSDLVTGNYNSANVSVLISDGAGGWTGAAANTVVGTGPQMVTLGDLNGDGKNDLAVANYSSSNVSVLIGNGSGGWAGAATNTTIGAGPICAALGDFNGDGRLDLLATSFIATTASLLLGNGAGGWTAAAVGVLVGATPRGCAMGDFNGDGLLDAVVANTGTTTVSLLLGTSLWSNEATQNILISGLLTGTAIISPAFSGTSTGTYTLGGTPTIVSPLITTAIRAGTDTATTIGDATHRFRRRYEAGTTITATNIVPGGGWGHNAVVSMDVAASSDPHMRYKITAPTGDGGVDITANPTITITLKDGTCTNLAWCRTKLETTIDTTMAAPIINDATSATQDVITIGAGLGFTPVADKTYTFSTFCECG